MRGKRAWALLATVVVLAAMAVSASAQENALTAVSDIRQESTDRATRLIVECTGPVAYTYYSPDPLTLVVDIPEADASTIPSRINVGTREVESLRVTNMVRGDGRSLARIEVRLASLVPFQIYSKDTSLNLVFERPGGTVAAEPVEAPAQTPVAETSAPAPEPVEEVRLVPEPEAVEPALEPEPPAPRIPATPATRILGVAQDEQVGALAFTVYADGRLDYQDFFLGNPDRLVVDFPGVLNRSPRRTIDVNEDPVQRVRIAQFSADSPRVARLVLDLSERAPYRIVDASDGLKIVFGEGETPSPAPLAALRAPEPSAAPPAPPSFGPPTPLVPAPLAPQEGTVLTATGARPGAEGRKFTGHPINLDFKDGDLVDIFRLFADISGLNVVINPGVSGRVSLKLTEVPWDQALDLILKTNSLGMTIDDNVIRIAKLADLQKEESDLRKLQEEKALAGNLVVWRKTLSYAKATQLQPTIQKVSLSARGSITLDERTNTMIITDLQDNVDKARDLIADLDRATPQVEIEARIVVTSRNFTRDIGIQWGFNHQQTTQFGNTTNNTFPNAIILNGQAVPGGGVGLGAGPGTTDENAIIGSPSRGYAVNLPAAGFTSALGISLGNILGNFNLDAALTALERQGRGRLLSTPKVTTQNNQAAEIKQGVQIPIQTVANNTVTVTFKDAVLTLKVTPQITDAGTVILGVEVENNSADFANLVQGIPPINTQSAKTNVLVRDGETAVIGGIYQSTEQSSENSTPFLSKIPILGYLFRNKFTTSQNNELLIFITPRIIKG